MLPISVGVARTKHLAKIASQVAKPDGLAVGYASVALRDRRTVPGAFRELAEREL